MWLSLFESHCCNKYFVEILRPVQERMKRILPAAVEKVIRSGVDHNGVHEEGEDDREDDEDDGRDG